MLGKAGCWGGNLLGVQLSGSGVWWWGNIERWSRVRAVAAGVTMMDGVAAWTLEMVPGTRKKWDKQTPLSLVHSSVLQQCSPHPAVSSCGL